MLKHTSGEESNSVYSAGATIPASEANQQSAEQVVDTRDIINQELQKRIGTFSNQELLDFKKQEETRIATEKHALWEQETQLRKEAVSLEEARNANKLAIAGSVSGMLAGSGVLFYGMAAHSVEWAIPGVALFAFGIAITSNRARDVITAYFGSKRKEKENEPERSNNQQSKS